MSNLIASLELVFASILMVTVTAGLFWLWVNRKRLRSRKF